MAVVVGRKKSAGAVGGKRGKCLVANISVIEILDLLGIFLVAEVLV